MRLTEEEALGLLEIAMTCPMELSPEQRSAVIKLGEYCRQLLRDTPQDRHTKDIADQARHLTVFAA